jgi:acetylornithine deacetylase/succinyl-diaminopimelate desuccinylase-like protein
MLKADVILVSDTMMIGQDTPSITCGLRGIAYLEVEITGANRDLHSGIFGGAVANPINILTKMVASLHDDKGHVTIKGFYDAVTELSETDRYELNKAPFDLNKYKISLGINQVRGEEGYTTLERTGIRPTLDVCGIWGGYTGEGSKTVIPSKAYAKISMRLVPNQDHEKVAQLFTEHFLSIAPDCVKVKVTNLHGGQAYVSPMDSVAYQAAAKALETTFGKRPIPVYSGGSIPIIATFEKVLGIKTILMGFGLDSDAIHSPNENFPVTNLFKGIESVIHFYENFGKRCS